MTTTSTEMTTGTVTTIDKTTVTSTKIVESTVTKTETAAAEPADDVALSDIDSVPAGALDNDPAVQQQDSRPFRSSNNSRLPRITRTAQPRAMQVLCRCMPATLGTVRNCIATATVSRAGKWLRMLRA